VIASNPNPQHWFGVPEHIYPGLGPPLPFNKWGILTLSYDPATGGLRMRASYATVADEDFTVDCSYTVSPQSFTQARVGTEFGSSQWDATYSHTPPANAGEAGHLRGAAGDLQRPLFGAAVMVGAPQAARPAVRQRPSGRPGRPVPEPVGLRLQDLARAIERTTLRPAAAAGVPAAVAYDAALARCGPRPVPAPCGRGPHV
jgi:hypothetical protein